LHSAATQVPLDDFPGACIVFVDHISEPVAGIKGTVGAINDPFHSSHAGDKNAFVGSRLVIESFDLPIFPVCDKQIALAKPNIDRAEQVGGGHQDFGQRTVSIKFSDIPRTVANDVHLAAAGDDVVATVIEVSFGKLIDKSAIVGPKSDDLFLLLSPLTDVNKAIWPKSHLGRVLQLIAGSEFINEITCFRVET